MSGIKSLAQELKQRAEMCDPESPPYNLVADVLETVSLWGILDEHYLYSQAGMLRKAACQFYRDKRQQEKEQSELLEATKILTNGQQKWAAEAF